MQVKILNRYDVIADDDFDQVPFIGLYIYTEQSSMFTCVEAQRDCIQLFINKILNK